MKRHNLKTDQEWFVLIMRDQKDFEVRLNNRNFQRGDELVLQEQSVQSCQDCYLGRIGPREKRAPVCLRPLRSLTGRQITVRVLNVFKNVPGVKEDYVVMPFQQLEYDSGVQIL